MGTGSLPTAPAGLCKEALARWRHLGPVLAAEALVGPKFRDTFALYCETWAEYWEFKAVIRSEGSTITAGNKTKIPHPCVQMKWQAFDRLLKLAQQIGLTPAAATGMNREGADALTDQDDPLDRMEKGGRASLRVTSAG